MQKSLIAVAVGGALAVIGAAPALAQNATVNVYGTFYGQYGSISNGRAPVTGDQFKRYDHFQNPGSEIGFRGEDRVSTRPSTKFRHRFQWGITLYAHLGAWSHNLRICCGSFGRVA